MELKETEVQKLNLQPGEVLVVKVKSDTISMSDLDGLKMGFQQMLPFNKVVLLAVPADTTIDLTIAKGADYPELSTNYCTDCNCGKKAAAEGINETN